MLKKSQGRPRDARRSVSTGDPSLPGRLWRVGPDPSFKSIEVSGGRATAIGPLKEPARLSETSDGWLIDEYGQ